MPPATRYTASLPLFLVTTDAYASQGKSSVEGFGGVGSKHLRAL